MITMMRYMARYIVSRATFRWLRRHPELVLDVAEWFGVVALLLVVVWAFFL